MTTTHHRVVSAAETAVTALIVANIPIAVWAEATHNETAELIDNTILWFFAVEIALRCLWAAKKRERPDVWLIVDTVIVVTALSGLPIMRAARLAHVSRHVEKVRHFAVARNVTRQVARRI